MCYTGQKQELFSIYQNAIKFNVHIYSYLYFKLQEPFRSIIQIRLLFASSSPPAN